MFSSSMVKHDGFLLLQQSPLCMWQNKTTIWIMGKHPEKRLRIVSRWVYYHWKELPKLYRGKYFILLCYSSPFLTEQNPNSESLLYYSVGLSNGIVSSVADNQAVLWFSIVWLFSSSNTLLLSFLTFWSLTLTRSSSQPSQLRGIQSSQHSHRIALQEILAGDGDKEEPWSQ